MTASKHSRRISQPATAAWNAMTAGGVLIMAYALFSAHLGHLLRRAMCGFGSVTIASSRLLRHHLPIHLLHLLHRSPRRPHHHLPMTPHRQHARHVALLHHRHQHLRHSTRPRRHPHRTAHPRLQRGRRSAAVASAMSSARRSWKSSLTTLP